MQIIFGYKTIKDISAPVKWSSDRPIAIEKRKAISIAVIDDEAFQAGRNLKNYGYDIVEIGDIINISEVSKYSIILCDIMNVGKKFHPDLQGAAIIREIRKNYPAVLVAAYTGSPISSAPARLARSYSDKFIQKDADIETWIEEMDSIIKSAADPRFIWSRLKISLAEENVDTKTILKIEDAYVRAVNQNDYKFTAIENIIKNEKISGTALDIVKNVISSSIFEIMSS